VGYYFLLYLVCDWLGRDVAGSTVEAVRSWWLAALRRGWLGGVLAVHAVGGVYAWGTDYRDVFSAGLPTARLLRQQGLDQRMIYALGGSELMPVSAYLGRALRFLPDGEPRHFVLPVATNFPPVDAMMSWCLDDCIINQRHAVVVSSHELEFRVEDNARALDSVVMVPWPEAPVGVRLWRLPRIDAIVGSESYFCLRLDYEPQVPATVK
jgi:hypothetical protein